MPYLEVEESFIITSVHRNNGVMCVLFSLPGGLSDEYILANLYTLRGVPENGQRYKITITPEFPHEKHDAQDN